jgi:hypothetical protein
MPVIAMFGINPVSDRNYRIEIKVFNLISLSVSGGWQKNATNDSTPVKRSCISCVNSDISPVFEVDDIFIFLMTIRTPTRS